MTTAHGELVEPRGAPFDKLTMSGKYLPQSKNRKSLERTEERWT